MTPEQLRWASEQFWFERSGADDEGSYVVGRECWGSRPALIFHEFDKLVEWAGGQRNLSAEIAISRPGEESISAAGSGMKTIFDVTVAPPTSAEMKLFEQQTIKNPWIERAWGAVMLFGGVLSLYCLFQNGAYTGTGVALPFHFWAGLVLGLGVFSGAWAYLILRIWPMGDAKSLLKSLSPHECSELADVIGSAMAPEVLRYRDGVLAQNRDFCVGDARAIQRYTAEYQSQQDLDKLRAKLYNPGKAQSEGGKA
jgi:hypothetical protein